MKLRFPEFKFPNTLLAAWWGAAMLAAALAPLTIRDWNGYSEQYILEKYLILLVGFGYFLAIELYTLFQAIQENRNSNDSLLEKWLRVMGSNHSVHISAVIPLLALPTLYCVGSHIMPIDKNIFEILFATGSYGGFGKTPSHPVLFAIYGSVIVYLHISVLAAWLSLLGLVLNPRRIMMIAVGVLVLVVSLNFLTNTLIEVPMRAAAYGDWHCEPEQARHAEEYSDDCHTYWTYRSLNRFVETIEYGFYGTLSGGLQFLNSTKYPVWREYISGTEWYDTASGEFVRNLTAGIISPSLQLFFIMRYLKKRSFEKAKREYAA
jgi:hypothetical protein